MTNTLQRITELTEKINYYSKQYYQNNVSEISDYEFDMLLEELNQLENEFPEFRLPDSPTQKVGSDIDDNSDEKVEHKYPMLSLGNTYSEEELLEFDKRTKKILIDEGLDAEKLEYICELKFDGVSLSLTYENNQLVRAVTRGDGVKGDNVTHNAVLIQSIPQKIEAKDAPKNFEVRGEVFLPREKFDRLNEILAQRGENLFANPRNTASGLVKHKDPSKRQTKKNKEDQAFQDQAQTSLDCYLYYLLGENLPFESHEKSIQALEKWGFNVSPTYQKCKSMEEVMQYINHWDKERKKLPLDTDGVVIKVNDFQMQEVLGFTSKSPRWAISYKYKAESIATILESVTYQVGRTGAITPVAELKPVFLAGTTVKRASLHNANEIERLGLQIGDTVFVEKGGEIIPKVTGFDVSKRPANATTLVYIQHCPECGTELIRREGEAQHYCPNEKGCPPQVKGKIEHFIHRKAMNIENLGGETIDKLYDLNLLRDIADLYDLTAEKLAQLPKFKEKSIKNALEGIEKSKETPFEQVLFGIGIRFVGATVARKLAEHFKNIENLAKASLEELTQVEDIGGRIAESLVDFFANQESQHLIERLKKAGLQFEIAESATLQESNIFEGKTFVISGVFKTFSRDELQAKILANGGKIISSISAKLDYLVAGENMGPAKLEKAQKLNIKMLSEEEFLGLLN